LSAGAVLRRMFASGNNPALLDSSVAAKRKPVRRAVARRNRPPPVSRTEQGRSGRGHVELFSSWALNMSPAGRRVLEQMGRPVPDDAAYPTGAEFASAYVDVLAAWLTQQSGRCDIRLGCEVTAIGRGHLLKKDDVGGRRQRARTPFRVLVASEGEEDAAVGESSFLLDFLLDCSGTWNQVPACCTGPRASARPARAHRACGGAQPNWCGVGGAPACNERALVAAGRVLQHIADPAATPRAFLGALGAISPSPALPQPARRPRAGAAGC
jgi:hypothetical protein